jgi:hypothetical protein
MGSLIFRAVGLLEEVQSVQGQLPILEGDDALDPSGGDEE